MIASIRDETRVINCSSLRRKKSKCLRSVQKESHDFDWAGNERKCSISGVMPEEIMATRLKFCIINILTAICRRHSGRVHFPGSMDLQENRRQRGESTTEAAVLYIYNAGMKDTVAKSAKSYNKKKLMTGNRPSTGSQSDHTRRPWLDRSNQSCPQPSGWRVSQSPFSYYPFLRPFPLRYLSVS
jgi:hypothetical protein